MKGGKGKRKFSEVSDEFSKGVKRTGSGSKAEKSKNELNEKSGGSAIQVETTPALRKELPAGIKTDGDRFHYLIVSTLSEVKNAFDQGIKIDLVVAVGCRTRRVFATIRDACSAEGVKVECVDRGLKIVLVSSINDVKSIILPSYFIILPSPMSGRIVAHCKEENLKYYACEV